MVVRLGDDGKRLEGFGLGVRMLDSSLMDLVMAPLAEPLRRALLGTLIKRLGLRVHGF